MRRPAESGLQGPFFFRLFTTKRHDRLKRAAISSTGRRPDGTGFRVGPLMRSSRNMPQSRSEKLVDKSEAAMISAIEIYNKPDYRYRDETFSILALNAWELLLKGKLVTSQ
jgi:hypothetical protein